MSSVLRPLVIENCLSVKNASEFSGYSQQYLRRLLRLGKLEGTKIGQVWLIGMKSFEWYLSEVGNSQDHRFGPK
jgi:hypothetical protein